MKSNLALLAKLRQLIMAVLAIAVIPAATTSAQTKIDWRVATTFPGLSFEDLTSAQKALAITKLREANCPCGCGMKMAECLIDDPTCPQSPGIARQIVLDVRNGNARPTQSTSGVLHVVMVIDSYDSSIGQHCGVDGMRMRDLFQENVSQRQLRFDLSPEQESTALARITPQNILDRISRLPVGRNDAVLFYFSGHGGYTPETGHYFKMHHSPQLSLSRATLRKAMQSLSPRLGVILSDCCFGRNPNLEGCAPAGAGELVVTRNLMNSLFFKPSGFVDITSSKQDQLSYCVSGAGDDLWGGVFSVALLDVAYDNLDRDLSWSRFHALVADKTEQTFDLNYPFTSRRYHRQLAQASAKVIERSGLHIPVELSSNQTNQTPFAFSLAQ